ncbi:hypothetical protein ACFORH_04860 [Amycolatopsis roodepoortensis]|uniref:Uncharacterized protein n=1 Tax=Amycolatopsis roodepoortensis TaxID=700274 RepID=A0ABR9L6U1_9PSEU|nr:hypothetical protein [Amycolatopsis roodepoortensis]MBE1576335.1 hypothetical protein [Amycolatopsis roodepoortensis]
MTFTAEVVPDSNSGLPWVNMQEFAEFSGTGMAVEVGGTVGGHDHEATRSPCA